MAVSPYCHPTDHGEAPEKPTCHIGMFDRRGSPSLDCFTGSGAGFLPESEQQVEDGETIITSPHEVYVPEGNDLVLQLRKTEVDRVILAAMSANLGVEAHLHGLSERGFEVAVVSDATAAAELPEGDGYPAAIANFRYIANALWNTDEAVARFSNG